ncbi:hypothetical protein L1887_03247 [Cichorium endivia]|nr:hypothetical protein L1887_03247 [Cichorium endivia]
MATTGKVDVEVKVKSDAEKFWKSIKEFATTFPKVCPNIYEKVEVLEGDGFSVGSVREVHFGEGMPFVKSRKEKIEEFDETKKRVTFRVIGGDIMEYYNIFKVTTEVTPDGEGSLAKWICEFEKISDEVPDPIMAKETAANNFKEIDAYLLKA